LPGLHIANAENDSTNTKYTSERNIKKMIPDIKKMGQINALMLTFHNKSAENIASNIQVKLLDEYQKVEDDTPEQAYKRALEWARDMAKAQIKDSITLK
jgi:hypothetical protein